jgi:hypothetical protein
VKECKNSALFACISASTATISSAYATLVPAGKIEIERSNFGKAEIEKREIIWRFDTNYGFNDLTSAGLINGLYLLYLKI